MMHVTFADKSLLVGDRVADLLVEYCAILARDNDADTISLNAYSNDGQKVVAKFALSEGAALLAESTETDLPDPENDEAERYLRARIDRRTSPPPARPAHDTGGPCTTNSDCDRSGPPSDRSGDDEGPDIVRAFAVEPPVGIEPTTYSLRVNRSAD